MRVLDTPTFALRADVGVEEIRQGVPDGALRPEVPI